MPGGTPKYEREIAEILDRLDRNQGQAPATPGPRSPRQAPPRRTRRRWDLGLSRFGQFSATWRWLGLTVALGIGGAVVRPFAPLLGVLLGLLMVLVFLSPMLSALPGGTGHGANKVWRGQVIELPPRGGFLARAGYRWRRFVRGRR